MKKSLLLLLLLLLTLACFANTPDRSHLYTVQETVEISLPEDAVDEWNSQEGYWSADIYMKLWSRENDAAEREEDIQILSRHLFGSNALEVGDLLPMYLKDDKDGRWDVALVEELENGVIVRVIKEREVEWWEISTNPDGERVVTSGVDTEEVLHLARLILSDRAHHVVEYMRNDNAELVDWSEEDQALWTECLRKAQLVPLG